MRIKAAELRERIKDIPDDAYIDILVETENSVDVYGIKDVSVNSITADENNKRYVGYIHADTKDSR